MKVLVGFQSMNCHVIRGALVCTVSMDIIFLDISVLFGFDMCMLYKWVMSYLFSICDNEKGGVCVCINYEVGILLQ